MGAHNISNNRAQNIYFLEKTPKLSDACRKLKKRKYMK